MNELLELLNKAHQRAGLLAVLTGVLQTSDCEATKKSIAQTLEHIFSEFSVNDDVERITKSVMNEVLSKKEDSFEDHMKEMLNMMREVLKDNTPS
jgi:hypothetical protein